MTQSLAFKRVNQIPCHQIITKHHGFIYYNITESPAGRFNSYKGLNNRLSETNIFVACWYIQPLHLDLSLISFVCCADISMKCLGKVFIPVLCLVIKSQWSFFFFVINQLEVVHNCEVKGEVFILFFNYPVFVLKLFTWLEFVKIQHI